MTLCRIKAKLGIIARFVSNESRILQDEIARIVGNCLAGEWKNATSNNLLIEQLRGGCSNWLYHITLSNSQKEPENQPKTVLLRFHQPLDPNFIFEYVSESLAFMYLSERKLGPKLLGIFPGGRIEEYIDARPLTADELGNPNFSFAIAAKMAQIHSMDVPFPRKNGALFESMEKWLLHSKRESFSWENTKFGNDKCTEHINHHDLLSEISWLREFLGDLNSPIIFCHNDAQAGNILVTYISANTKKPDITFIDYEYCSYNYRGFEFANHFLEYTMSYQRSDYPNFIINEENYPSAEHQLKFIRRYLSVKKQIEKHRKTAGDEIFYRPSLEFFQEDEDVADGEMSKEEADFLNEISHFRLASHLLWGIWAALRCQSKIEFGFREYCFTRLKAYFRTKEELTSFKTG